MKSSFTIFNILLLFILFSQLSPLFAQWQKNIIDNDINLAVSVDVADMVGDAKLDLIVTNFNGSKLILYQNNFSQWIKHTVANVSATFAYSGDMDGDDTLDIVASLYNTRDLVWYENNHPTWTKHIIDDHTDNTDFILVADFDNDDTLDVVAAGGYTFGGDVVWYENNHPIWKKHIIESGSSKYASLTVADIDDDGLLDLAATMCAESKVVWFRNEDYGISWTKYPIDNNLAKAWGINNFDINGDNKIDIIATGQNANSVVWYENNHPTWTKHPITTNLPGANWVDVTDVNGDDKIDVIASGFSADDVVWYENNHTEWNKHIIDPNLYAPRVFAITDIDGDNTNDLVVPAQSSVVWYKNPNTKVAFGQSLDVYPKYISTLNDITLDLVANIYNPEYHQVEVYATIQIGDSVIADSIVLYDDGLHNDELASDNIFGSRKQFASLKENFYSIKLYTNDLYDSISIMCANKGYFTTVGPVVWKVYDIIQQNDSAYTMKVTLENNSSLFTVPDVSAQLSTNDSNIADIHSSHNPQFYPDIEPGQSVNSSGTYGYVFYTKNKPENVEFVLNILSNKIRYWTDTVKVDFPTDIEDELLNLPKEFTLKQNYPNPFNPSTTIKYSIPKQSDVTVKVYDVLGSEVATLVNKEQSQGNYELEFDGTELTSGIYFYRLRAGEFVETRKMILIK